MNKTHPSGIPAHEVTGKWRGFVWQNTDPRFANAATPELPRLQKRRAVVPHQPRTPLQNTWHVIFGLHTHDWARMTPEEKAMWNARAPAEKKYSGYHLYMSVTMKTLAQQVQGINPGGRKTRPRR